MSFSKNSILVQDFREPGFAPFKKTFLSDDAYAEALSAMLPMCVDAVPIRRTAREILLSRRSILPAKDWWWIGGRMCAGGETKEEAMVRIFKQDTGLELNAERFTLVAVLDHQWKDRQQFPQNRGSHTPAYTFIVELSADEEEVAAANLETKEYVSHVLRGFNYTQIVQTGMLPQVLAVYDHIFPQPKVAPALGKMKKVSSDARRTIYEFNAPDSGFSTQYFEVHQSVPLGNHFHTGKEEYFTIMSGGGWYYSVPCDPETGAPLTTLTRERVETMSAITVPAYTAHTFVLDPGSTMYCYSTAPYDDTNKDMLSCVLVDPKK